MNRYDESKNKLQSSYVDFIESPTAREVILVMAWLCSYLAPDVDSGEMG
jgi:hypothetical protein